MDGAHLQDLISRGGGRAARKLGSIVTLFRPKDSGTPLGSRNRLLQLPAWFKAPGLANPIWEGVFDSFYTRPGDYLVGRQGIFFVTQQPAASQKVLCALTNTKITVIRDPGPANGGYGGLLAETETTVLLGWPASLLQKGSYGSAGGARDERFATWTLLLPVLPVFPQVGDVARDAHMESYVIGAAEQSTSGWHLTMRQVSA